MATDNSARAVVSVICSLPDFSHLNRFPTAVELTQMVAKLVASFGGYWDDERERQCRHAIESDGVENVVEYILSSAHYPREVITATLARMRGRLC